MGKTKKKITKMPITKTKKKNMHGGMTDIFKNLFGIRTDPCDDLIKEILREKLKKSTLDVSDKQIKKLKDYVITQEEYNDFEPHHKDITKVLVLNTKSGKFVSYLPEENLREVNIDEIFNKNKLTEKFKLGYFKRSDIKKIIKDPDRSNNTGAPRPLPPAPATFRGPLPTTPAVFKNEKAMVMAAFEKIEKNPTEYIFTQKEYDDKKTALEGQEKKVLVSNDLEEKFVSYKLGQLKETVINEKGELLELSYSRKITDHLDEYLTRSAYNNFPASGDFIYDSSGEPAESPASPQNATSAEHKYAVPNKLRSDGVTYTTLDWAAPVVRQNLDDEDASDASNIGYANVTVAGGSRTKKRKLKKKPKGKKTMKGGMNNKLINSRALCHLKKAEEYMIGLHAKKQTFTSTFTGENVLLFDDNDDDDDVVENIKNSYKKLKDYVISLEDYKNSKLNFNKNYLILNLEKQRNGELFTGISSIVSDKVHQDNVDYYLDRKGLLRKHVDGTTEVTAEHLKKEYKTRKKFIEEVKNKASDSDNSSGSHGDFVMKPNSDYVESKVLSDPVKALKIFDQAIENKDEKSAEQTLGPILNLTYGDERYTKRLKQFRDTFNDSGPIYETVPPDMMKSRLSETKSDKGVIPHPPLYDAIVDSQDTIPRPGLVGDGAVENSQRKVKEVDDDRSNLESNKKITLNAAIAKLNEAIANNNGIEAKKVLDEIKKISPNDDAMIKSFDQTITELFGNLTDSRAAPDTAATPGDIKPILKELEIEYKPNIRNSKEANNFLRTEPNFTFFIRHSSDERATSRLVLSYKNGERNVNLFILKDENTGKYSLKGKIFGEYKLQNKEMQAFFEGIKEAFEKKKSESKWLKPDFNREKANSELSGKSPGYFFVRPSKRFTSGYTLSYVNKSKQIEHPIIQKNNEQKFYLDYREKKYDTVGDLIDAHSKAKLPPLNIELIIEDTVKNEDESEDEDEFANQQSGQSSAAIRDQERRIRDREGGRNRREKRNYNLLKKNEWFKPDFNLETAKLELSKKKSPGYFFVRSSNQSKSGYALSYVDKNSDVKHLNIEQTNDLFNLENTSTSYGSIYNLIDTHSEQELPPLNVQLLMGSDSDAGFAGDSFEDFDSANALEAEGREQNSITSVITLGDTAKDYLWGKSAGGNSVAGGSKTKKRKLKNKKYKKKTMKAGPRPRPNTVPKRQSSKKK